MSHHFGAAPAVARASAGSSIDQIADLLKAIAGYTSRAQIDNFMRLLYGRLHHAAGGMLTDDQAELLQKMAQRHVEQLDEARAKRLPPTKSWFPIRAKSNKSREEAATGHRDPSRWARKQRLGGLAALPPTEEYQGITEGERAVLYIIAADVRETGSCQCTVAEIADRAGVGKTTAKNAIRKARDRGMLKVTHRPQWRSKWLSNVITIVCKTWLGWLKKFRPNLGFKFKGVRKPASTDTYGFKDRKGQPSVQPEGGPSGRFQRFASRKPPSD
ncbi:hypothetical protein ASF91_19630 [Rhizobium sp. Leaf155]|nr:hypothetical protein ASF91_19630 [Rhizobium sp. Leaf155]